MRQHHKHVLGGVELRQSRDGPFRLRDVVRNVLRRHEEGLCRACAWVAVDLLEERAGTGRAAEGVRVEMWRGERAWKGEVWCWAELTAEMAGVAAHQDEGRRRDARGCRGCGCSCGRCACEAAEVADSVAGGVEEVERAIVEVVVCVEAAEFEAGVTGDFSEVAIREVFVAEGGVGVRGIAWGIGLFESGSNDDIGGCWEFGWLSGVVPMMVAPNDCFDVI